MRLMQSVLAAFRPGSEPKGVIMGYVHPRQVRYYEVDQQGVVFNAWYLAWFDEAMSGFLRHKGLLSDMGDEGSCQLVRSEIDWRDGVRYGDDVTIRVEPGRIGTTSFVMHYTVLRGSDITCVAKIVYVSIHRDGSGKRPVPPLLRKALT
jgi:acyl-CoA thioester hydrolase